MIKIRLILFLFFSGILFDKGQGRCSDHVYFPVPWLQSVVRAAQTLTFSVMVSTVYL